MNYTSTEEIRQEVIQLQKSGVMSERFCIILRTMVQGLARKIKSIHPFDESDLQDIWSSVVLVAIARRQNVRLEFNLFAYYTTIVLNEIKSCRRKIIQNSKIAQFTEKDLLDHLID